MIHYDPPESFPQFMQELGTRCGVSEAHADLVRKVWAAIMEAENGNVPLPSVERTADELRIQLSWRPIGTAFSLLIEIAEDGDLWWFAHDGKSKTTGSSEDPTAFRAWVALLRTRTQEAVS